MSVIHATFGYVKGRSRNGLTMPVIDSSPVQAKTATSTSSWAEVTSFPAPDVSGFWDITVLSGGACRVFFGASAPTGNDVGYAIPEGTSRNYSPRAAGEKLFIKDA
jgi:hypothetical protein